MTPGQRSSSAGSPALADLEPDLVVDTGDNLAHARAVPAVLDALEPLLSRPGSSSWAATTTSAPTFKNPARYLVPAWRSASTASRCRGATCGPR